MGSGIVPCGNTLTSVGEFDSFRPIFTAFVRLLRYHLHHVSSLPLALQCSSFQIKI